MPDEHPSFWATMPGILTGIAALITALVGAAALILGLRGETEVQTDPPTEASEGEGNENATTVEMRIGDGLDVDTGRVGDVSDWEVFYSSSGGWDLRGNRAALVEGEPDKAGCAQALDRRSDDYLRSKDFDHFVLCLETSDGSAAQVRPSEPDTSGNTNVQVIVWS